LSSCGFTMKFCVHNKYLVKGILHAQRISSSKPKGIFAVQRDAFSVDAWAVLW